MGRLEAAAPTSSAERLWIAAQRRAIPDQPSQWGLWFAHRYIDDPLFAAVGHSRTLRLVRASRTISFRMAIAAKRSAGAAVSWLGVRFWATLGLAILPPDKRLRALADVRSASTARSRSLTLSRYVAAWFASACWWAYPRPLFAEDRPSSLASPVSPAHLSMWLSALAGPAGLCLSSILCPPARPLAALPSPPTPSCRLFVDAAKSSARASSCFCAYAHGAWLSLPIPSILLTGPSSVSISVLEPLRGFCLATVDSVLGRLPLSLLSDSLRSVLSFAGAPRVPALRCARSRLLDFPP